VSIAECFEKDIDQINAILKSENIQTSYPSDEMDAGKVVCPNAFKNVAYGGSVIRSLAFECACYSFIKLSVFDVSFLHAKSVSLLRLRNEFKR